jgi:hypothetical protein
MALIKRGTLAANNGADFYCSVVLQGSQTPLRSDDSMMRLTGRRCRSRTRHARLQSASSGCRSPGRDWHASVIARALRRSGDQTLVRGGIGTSFRRPLERHSIQRRRRRDLRSSGIRRRGCQRAAPGGGLLVQSFDSWSCVVTLNEPIRLQPQASAQIHCGTKYFSWLCQFRESYNWNSACFGQPKYVWPK